MMGKSEHEGVNMRREGFGEDALCIGWTHCSVCDLIIPMYHHIWARATLNSAGDSRDGGTCKD